MKKNTLNFSFALCLMTVISVNCDEGNNAGNTGYESLTEKSQVKYKISEKDGSYEVKFKSKFFIGSEVEFDMPDDMKGRGIVRAIKLDDSGKIKYFVLAEDNDSLIEFEEAALSLIRDKTKQE